MVLPLLLIFAVMVVGVLLMIGDDSGDKLGIIVTAIGTAVVLLLMQAILKGWVVDTTTYLVERDGKQTVDTRLLVLRLLPLAITVALTVWVLFSLHFLQGYGAALLIVYGAIFYPILFLWLQRNLFRHWFVVEDEVMLTQWLIDKQKAKEQG
jgi:hypothetical protein